MSYPKPDSYTPSWREDLFQDAARILGQERPSLKSLAGNLVQDAGLAAAALFRLAARLSRGGHPWMAAAAGRINLALHGCQIHPGARIGPGFRLAHPTGVVVGRGVRAGRDLTLFQSVTLGARSWRGEDYPALGDGVVVYPNSLVIGAIQVGAGARVGAGSVVLKDVAPGDTVVGSPAIPLDRSKHAGGSASGRGME